MDMKTFIAQTFLLTKTKNKYVETLTTPEALSYYTTSFTDSSYDEDNNYKYFRTLGQISLHKIVMWYLFRRFKKEKPSQLTLMKNNFIESKKIGKKIIEEKLLKGFSSFILYDKVNIDVKMIQKLFEAFIGITELFINKKYKQGIGYVVVNKFCIYLLNQIEDIDFTYDKDPKTKLKEFMQTDIKYEYEIEYKNEKDEKTSNFNVRIFLKDKRNNVTLIGEGNSNTTINAEKEAALISLEYFKKRGLYKVKDDIDEKREKQRNPLVSNKDFKDMILSLLKTVHFLKDLDLNENDMKCYASAFTHPDVNPVSTENYESLETLGDNTVNKCILWYISDYFYQLNNPYAIDIITRLKINLAESHSLAKFSKQSGFSPFILVPPNQTELYIRKALEDVFESFIAATEMVIDSKYKKGLGYIVCYQLISNILEKENLHINYDDLVDPKTQLKELNDNLKIFDIQYINDKKNRRSILNIKNKVSGKAYQLFSNPSNDSKECEKNVAKKGLEELKKDGFVKSIPKEYLKFCI